MKIQPKVSLAWVFATALLLLATSSATGQDALEKYISQGLNDNLVIKQKNISLDKAVSALDEAKSYFLPGVNFSGSYVTGHGGRDIPLPIGDLLNPVYTTLNGLTHSNQFPQVQNQTIYFFPTDFYDVHLHTTMPLVNTDLGYNKTIKNEQIQLAGYEVETYKRSLVKDIKTAYYNYLMAISAQKIYENAITLLQKNVDVNKSLQNNGIGLQQKVLRAQGELENVQAQLNDSKNQADNARRYFNFLLNRKTDEAIDTAYNANGALADVQSYLGARNVSAREELKMAQTGRDIYENLYHMNKRFWVPKIGAFLDLGSQAEGIVVNSQSLYYLVGAQVDIPVFNWNRYNFKTKQAQADFQIAELNSQYTSNGLALSLSVAQNGLSTSYENFKTSQNAYNIAKSYFKMVDDGYREGVNNQIEYLDARNQLTTSQLMLTINMYKALQAMAAVERESATYVFKK